MNFLTAFLHAVQLRKGFRRQAWPTDVWLLWNERNDQRLYWNQSYPQEMVPRPVTLGDERSKNYQKFYDMSPDDLNANDWEVV